MRYKPWSGDPGVCLGVCDDNEQHWISEWNSFRESDLGAIKIASWKMSIKVEERKDNNESSSDSDENCDIETDEINENAYPQDDWMIASN